MVQLASAAAQAIRVKKRIVASVGAVWEGWPGRGGIVKGVPVVEEKLMLTNKGVVIPIAMVGALVAAIWYASALHSQVQSLQKDISQMQREYRERSAGDVALSARLARMDALLETIISRLPREGDHPIATGR